MTASPRMIAESGLERVAAPATGDVRSEVFERFRVLVVAGVTVGVLVVGIGSRLAMLVHSDGVDFRLLKPLWLAIGLFVALPALFAVAIGIGVDRVASANSWTKVGRRRWALPLVLVLIAGFPAVLFVAVPALLVLAVWVPVRRSVERIGDVPFGLRVAVRGAWLAVAVAGLIALARDVGDLA